MDRIASAACCLEIFWIAMQDGLWRDVGWQDGSQDTTDLREIGRRDALRASLRFHHPIHQWYLSRVEFSWMALGCAFVPHPQPPLRHGEGAKVWGVSHRFGHQDGLYAPLLRGEGTGVRLVEAIHDQKPYT